jgi:DNA-binding transcriptional LysR family regulator
VFRLRSLRNRLAVVFGLIVLGAIGTIYLTVTPRLEERLRIKCPTTLTIMHFGDLLTRFQAAHPGVKMELVLIDRSVNPVEEAFDLAIGALPTSYANVVDIPLCPMPRTIVASPGYLERAGTPRHPRDRLTASENDPILLPLGDLRAVLGRRQLHGHHVARRWLRHGGRPDRALLAKLLPPGFLLELQSAEGRLVLPGVGKVRGAGDLVVEPVQIVQHVLAQAGHRLLEVLVDAEGEFGGGGLDRFHPQGVPEPV